MGGPIRPLLEASLLFRELPQEGNFLILADWGLPPIHSFGHAMESLTYSWPHPPHPPTHPTHPPRHPRVKRPGCWARATPWPPGSTSPASTRPTPRTPRCWPSSMLWAPQAGGVEGGGRGGEGWFSVFLDVLVLFLFRFDLCLLVVFFCAFLSVFAFVPHASPLRHRIRAHAAKAERRSRAPAWLWGLENPFVCIYLSPVNILEGTSLSGF